MDIYYGEFPKEAVKDTVSPATQQCDLATEHVKVILGQTERGVGVGQELLVALDRL